MGPYFKLDEAIDILKLEGDQTFMHLFMLQVQNTVLQIWIELFSTVQWHLAPILPPRLQDPKAKYAKRLQVFNQILASFHIWNAQNVMANWGPSLIVIVIKCKTIDFKFGSSGYRLYTYIWPTLWYQDPKANCGKTWNVFKDIWIVSCWHARNLMANLGLDGEFGARSNRNCNVRPGSNVALQIKSSVVARRMKLY